MEKPWTLLSSANVCRRATQRLSSNVKFPFFDDITKVYTFPDTWDSSSAALQTLELRSGNGRWLSAPRVGVNVKFPFLTRLRETYVLRRQNGWQASGTLELDRVFASRDGSFSWSLGEIIVARFGFGRTPILWRMRHSWLNFFLFQFFYLNSFPIFLFHFIVGWSESEILARAIENNVSPRNPPP